MLIITGRIIDEVEDASMKKPQTLVVTFILCSKNDMIPGQTDE